MFEVVRQLLHVSRVSRTTFGLFSLVLALAAHVAAVPVPCAAAPGDFATKWVVNDEDPSKSVPPLEERGSDPIEFGYWLQDMLERAETKYYLKGDWKNAAKYYSVLAEAIPDNPISHSRLCHAYKELRDYPNVLKSCARAMSLKGARVIDHLYFLEALVNKPELAPQDVAAAEASLKHLREHAHLNPQALPGQEPRRTADQVELSSEMTAEEKKANPEKWMKLKAMEAMRASAGEPAAEKAAGPMHLPTQIEIFNCRLGARTGDATRLDQCTDRLHSYGFPQKLIFPFRWAKAIARGDRKQADALLLEGEKRHGIKGDVLAAMKRDQGKAFGEKVDGKLAAPVKKWLLPAGLALVLALGLVAALLVRRLRRTVRAPQQSDGVPQSDGA